MSGTCSDNEWQQTKMSAGVPAKNKSDSFMILCFFMLMWNKIYA